MEELLMELTMFKDEFWHGSCLKFIFNSQAFHANFMEISPINSTQNHCRSISHLQSTFETLFLIQNWCTTVVIFKNMRIVRCVICCRTKSTRWRILRLFSFIILLYYIMVVLYFKLANIQSWVNIFEKFNNYKTKITITVKNRCWLHVQLFVHYVSISVN